MTALPQVQDQPVVQDPLAVLVTRWSNESMEGAAQPRAYERGRREALHGCAADLRAALATAPDRAALLAEAQILRLSLEDERRRADALAAALRSAGEDLRVAASFARQVTEAEQAAGHPNAAAVASEHWDHFDRAVAAADMRSRADAPGVSARAERELLAAGEHGFKEALRGVAGLLDAFLQRAHAAGAPPAKAHVNVSELLLLVNRHRENPPTPFLKTGVAPELLGATPSETAQPAAAVRECDPIARREAERLAAKWGVYTESLDGEHLVLGLIEAYQLGWAASAGALQHAAAIGTFHIREATTLRRELERARAEVLDTSQRWTAQVDAIRAKLSAALPGCPQDVEVWDEAARRLSAGAPALVAPATADSGRVGTLTGKTVVFTGRLSGLTPAEARAAVERAGGTVATVVDLSTDLLVAGEGPGSRLAVALRNGVPVVGEAGFSMLLERARRAQEGGR